MLPTGLGAGASPCETAVGADANLWFTESTGKTIGRLDLPLAAANTTVNAADGGAGSLRDAITQSNSHGGADMIVSLTDGPATTTWSEKDDVGKLGVGSPAQLKQRNVSGPRRSLV